MNYSWYIINLNLGVAMEQRKNYHGHNYLSIMCTWLASQKNHVTVHFM